MNRVKKLLVLGIVALVCFLVGIFLIFGWQNVSGIFSSVFGHKIVFENYNSKLLVEFNSDDPVLKEYLGQIGIWNKQGIQMPVGERMETKTVEGKIVIRLETIPLSNVRMYGDQHSPYLTYDIKLEERDLIILVGIETDPEKLGAEQNERVKQDLTYLISYVLTRVTTKYGRVQQGTVNPVDDYLTEQKVISRMRFIEKVEVLQ